VVDLLEEALVKAKLILFIKSLFELNVEWGDVVKPVIFSQTWLKVMEDVEIETMLNLVVVIMVIKVTT
jgi:hypothetical protein